MIGFVLGGCGPGELLGPTLTPTPEPTPTPDAIAGIDTPITVSDAQLLIVTATNDPSQYSTGGFGVKLSSPDVILFYVEARVVSGDVDLTALMKTISLTDENDVNCSMVASGTEKPFWLFAVPKSSQSFTLHLGDESIVLDTILDMVP